MSLLQGKVGLVGATGVVGRELLALFEKHSLEFEELRLMASSRSAGQSLSVSGKPYEVLEARAEHFEGLDLLFLMTSSSIARELVPEARKQNVTCIDLSSAFRMDPEVPLVVPEVNPDSLKNHQGLIANGNCCAIILLLPLALLHRRWKVKRAIVCTYQSASGAGLEAMKELESQTAEVLAGRQAKAEIFKYPIAFNLFSHDSDIEENGYCGEENKLVAEIHKVLDDKSLEILPTCVRVPILRAHTEALTLEFEEEPDLEEARSLLSQASGITLIDDRENNRFPMPLDASGGEDVFVGRLRKGGFAGKGLSLMVVGDQLLKGSAQNALQIAQLL